MNKIKNEKLFYGVILPLIPSIILFFPAITSAFPATVNLNKTVTVYTYGSGYIEYGVFIAVAGFVHSNGFAIITKLLAGVGILLSLKVFVETENYGGINFIPQSFFINNKGHITFHWSGPVNAVLLQTIVSKMIKLEN